LRRNTNTCEPVDVKMHPDELSVTVENVENLVYEQFPEWTGLPIKKVRSHGTVNALFKIGDRLVARLPLVAQDVDELQRQVESEARAARELLGRTRFPTPVPVGIGAPGGGYPLPWSVQTWLSGSTADDADAGESIDFAHDLAEFIRGVRAIPMRGRKHHGSGRGGDLRSHDEWVETCLQNSEQLLDVPHLRRIWNDLRQLPRTRPDVMNHGDLIPGNVLVSGGRLAGVIDLGSLGPADPALDLVSAWHLLDVAARQVLRDDLQCNDLEWERGQAWAFVQALGVVWYYVDSNPTFSAMGRRTLDRIMAATRYR
jgi:aminoglycoside phosphotransferase (APT) family kinase protein